MHFEYKSLYITDEPKRARAAKEEGRYVVLALPLLDDGSDFEPDISAYPYALENVMEVDHAYLDKLILRFENKPWLILETKRCRIREITVDDVDALYEIYADKEITAYMEDLYETREQEIAYTKDYIACHYRLYGFGMWIVEEKADGRIIGRAGLDMVADRQACQLGFVIRKDRQCRGFATEVCGAILEYAFDELEFDTVEATCHRENRISVRLLEKLGFQPLGGQDIIRFEKRNIR